MFYLELVDEEFVKRDFDEAPPQIKELLLSARKNMIIKYKNIDWADDTSDAGMGYDYNNSYTLYYEPEIGKMIISDGKLYGYACRMVFEKIVMPLEDGAKAESRGHTSPRYRSGTVWEALNDPEPGLGSIVFISEFPGNPDLEAFPEGSVDSILRKYAVEDNHGYNSGNYQVWFKLSDKALENRDEILEKISKIAKERGTVIKYLDDPFKK